MKNEFEQLFNKIDEASILSIKISGDLKLIGKRLDDSRFTFEKIINKQAFHETILKDDLMQFLFEHLLKKNTNLTINASNYAYSFKISKKGKLLSNKTLIDDNITKKRIKNKDKFLLPLDIPVLFRLGLVTSEGKLIDRMRSKYEQISRFCELVVDAIGDKKQISIIDCGCGKAYLSFALYHYLTFDMGIKARIHGTDLKGEVIRELKTLASEYDYRGLMFLEEDIKNIDLSSFDMMISLHACDNATDFAIFNAIKGGVKTILSVPCCQQEMNKTLNSPKLQIFGQYGLIKERISALMTDAVRSSVLTAFGYKVKLVEIVDFEHSPKNIMIKAQKGNVSKQTRQNAYNDALMFLREFNTTCELFTLSSESLKTELFLEDKSL